MIDFFIPFFIGYGVATLSNFLIESSDRTSSDELSAIKNSIILKWDNVHLSWRPDFPSRDKPENARYIIGNIVNRETVLLLSDQKKH